MLDLYTYFIHQGSWVCTHFLGGRSHGWRCPSHGCFVPLSCILRTSILRTSDLQAATPLLPVPDRTHCRSEKNLSHPDFYGIQENQLFSYPEAPQGFLPLMAISRPSLTQYLCPWVVCQACVSLGSLEKTQVSPIFRALQIQGRLLLSL